MPVKITQYITPEWNPLDNEFYWYDIEVKNVPHAGRGLFAVTDKYLAR